VPGGYCGRILGDPGQTNIVGKVVFSLPAFYVGASSTESGIKVPIKFSSSTRVLLNDGAGTPAVLTTHDAEFTRIRESKNLRNEWTDAIAGDDTPPDEFIAEIQKDENAFSNKYFLVFSTVDKQSGLNHYEIMEEDALHLGKLFGTKNQALFVPATSPYVLKDQSLQSKITIRAIDNAGNKRDVVLLPKNQIEQSARTEGVPGWIPWAVFFILLIITILLAFVMYRKRSPEMLNPENISQNNEPNEHEEYL
jgi:hypothetical protein